MWYGSNDDAGTFGAVLIVAGLIGAAIAGNITLLACILIILIDMCVYMSGALLETTHAYRTILKGGFLLCQFAMMFFFVMLYSNNFVGLLVAFGLLGEWWHRESFALYPSHSSHRLVTCVLHGVHVRPIYAADASRCG